MPTNTAAWLGAKQADLDVTAAPYTQPGEDEIVVRNHAVAVNPLDWILQLVGSVIFPWISYPFILGSDLAGEVVEIGTAVTRFAVGDRVLAHAVGTDKDASSPARGTFQDYTVVLERLASPIPDSLPYQNAAVLPLGLSTAACGLFQQDQLGLQYPSTSPTPTGQTLLVWGGSSSVGSNAIQLAVAAGYEVITTASPHNVDYVTRLGASQVFDYRSTTVVDDVIRAFQGKTLAGAIAIGQGSADPCAAIIHACRGNKFLSTASTAASFDTLDKSRGLILQLPPVMLRIAWSAVALLVRCRLRGIRTKAIFGTTLKLNEVSRVIYEEFLPAALADGRYVAAPEPVVIGHGLECLQAGLDANKHGVSARKVVVTL